MQTAEPLVPETSSFEVEIPIEKLKRYKMSWYCSNSDRTDPDRM